jgi:hypothetical protein
MSPDRGQSLPSTPTRGKLPLKRFALLALAATVGWSAACSEDGATAKCPDMPLYTWQEFDKDSAVRKKVADWRAEAVDAGCVSPLGEDVDGPAIGSAGGSPASSGSGGASGGAGSN